jgi:hypothetical protein
MSWDIYQPEDDNPHVDSYICAKCRRQFQKGQRVVPVHIVAEAGAINPANLKEKGVELFAEFEFAHFDCRDPFLKRGLVG